MKSRIEDLAIFGGAPAFTKPLHVGLPSLGNREALLERINDLLDRRWFTNDGPFVLEFEQRVAERLGVRHCIATCNGTAALQITIRALEMTGEVIVPSFTFVATPHALQWQGITPVFCDVDLQTHNLKPDQVMRKVSPRTSGILAVHLWGRPCEPTALEEIAHRHGLKLVFDAAHAFGCSSGGTMIGNFGNAEVFSFHATKFFNTFEGGAVTTNEDALAAKIRLMRNFGFLDYDMVVSSGINAKMTEISAAMGLTSLEAMENFIASNRQHFHQYLEELEGLPEISVMAYDESEKCNLQYVVLEIHKDLTPVARDELLLILWAENILARRYFYPSCHRMEPYRSLYPEIGNSLPNTELLASRVLVLPTGPSMKPDDIRQVCEVIRFVVDHAPRIHENLQRCSSIPYSETRDI